MKNCWIPTIFLSGALGTFFQLFLTLGQLQVYILGIFDSYKILCYACTASSIVLFIGLPFIPESPLYLVKKKRPTDAEKVLRRLRGPHYDVSFEMKDMNERLENSHSPKISLSSIFTKVRLRSLIICIGLMVSTYNKWTNRIEETRLFCFRWRKGYIAMKT